METNLEPLTVSDTTDQRREMGNGLSSNLKSKDSEKRIVAAEDSTDPVVKNVTEAGGELFKKKNLDPPTKEFHAKDETQEEIGAESKDKKEVIVSVENSARPVVECMARAEAESPNKNKQVAEIPTKEFHNIKDEAQDEFGFESKANEEVVTSAQYSTRPVIESTTKVEAESLNTNKQVVDAPTTELMIKDEAKDKNVPPEKDATIDTAMDATSAPEAPITTEEKGHIGPKKNFVLDASTIPDATAAMTDATSAPEVPMTTAEKGQIGFKKKEVPDASTIADALTATDTISAPDAPTDDPPPSKRQKIEETKREERAGEDVTCATVEARLGVDADVLTNKPEPVTSIGLESRDSTVVDRVPDAVASTKSSTRSTASSSGIKRRYSDEYDENGTDDDNMKLKDYASAHLTAHHSRWHETFQRLLTYKEDNGNCKVPNRYPEDVQLGHWVSSQRRQYKAVRMGDTQQTAMTAERIAKLEAVGFQWESSDPRHLPWTVRYDELKAFVMTHGHCEVPMRWKKNVQLSNWVSKQRHDHKLRLRGTSQRLTDERFHLLNKLGFLWEAGAITDSRKRKDYDAFPPPREYHQCDTEKRATGSTGSVGSSQQESSRTRSHENDRHIAEVIQANLVALLANPAYLQSVGMNPIQLQLAAGLLVRSPGPAVQTTKVGMIPVPMPPNGAVQYFPVDHPIAAQYAQAQAQASQNAKAEAAAHAAHASKARAAAYSAQNTSAQTAAYSTRKGMAQSVMHQRAGGGVPNSWRGRGPAPHQEYAAHTIMAGRSQPNFPNAMNGGGAMHAAHTRRNNNASARHQGGRRADPPGDPPGADGPSNDEYFR